MSSRVLDASAVLAWLRTEPVGAAQPAAMAGDVISTVNLTEVLTRLIDLGLPVELALSQAEALPCRIEPFDADLALLAAALRPLTRDRGLSLGDRACLALARRRGSPAVTAHRAWEGLDVGVEIMLIR